jgi:prepilin-type N-terminal cleavage/methylation domain-containing protein
MGFTLFELMLVISIIGIMLAVMIPSAQRARYEAKTSLVRQNASEAGSYVVQWAQNKAHALHEKNSLSLVDFIMGTNIQTKVKTSNTGTMLVEHYTGNSVFDGVENLINPNTPILNPFNQVSIFDRLNDDSKVPGGQPGLLYLAAAGDDGKTVGARNLYFIFTGTNNSWYGSINTKNLNGIRHGIFVSRFSYPGISMDLTN